MSKSKIVRVEFRVVKRTPAPEERKSFRHRFDGASALVSYPTYEYQRDAQSRLIEVEVPTADEDIANDDTLETRILTVLSSSISLLPGESIEVLSSGAVETEGTEIHKESR